MSRSFLHQLGKCFYAFFSSKCFKLVVHFPYRKFLLTSLEVVLEILQEISQPNVSESHVDNVSRMCYNGCGARPMILTFPRFYHTWCYMYAYLKPVNSQQTSACQLSANRLNYCGNTSHSIIIISSNPNFSRSYLNLSTSEYCLKSH